MTIVDYMHHILSHSCSFVWAHWGSIEGLNWSRSVDSFGHAGPRLCRPKHAKAMISPGFAGTEAAVSGFDFIFSIMRHMGHPNCWLLNQRIWETTNCVAHLRDDYLRSVRFHCTTKSFFSPQRPSHRVTFVFGCSRLVMVMRSSMMGDPHQQNTSGGFNPPEQ